MHASSQHSKLEFMINEAKTLLARTDGMVARAKQEHAEIRKESAVRASEMRERDNVLNNEIQADLTSLAVTAESYLGVLDDTR